ncbi:MAG: alpha/beta hydrolase-fold protein [Gammaproteobacteria bacterium]|nr:alpha/beta hydrolase-fold protein [Gammaproteobacteria bacterium]MDH5304645.1 alpha/beta hydrolase-fold protein [Gammaproteobacteria bacterium]MDH5322498.1 alpha/beta hydrolase-fold protein [Gammaproteobacteria bacterium]
MTSKKTFIAILLGLLYVPVAADELPPIQMRNSEVRYLPSDIMDYEYGIFVTLPRGYADNPERIYPTLYIIDGHQYFVYTGEPYGSLIWGNMVKEHIAVSVAYTPEGGNMRSRDFQTRERAADFVRFFRHELIPFIETHYRTSAEDRTLFGHSLGGQFTLFTLLTATDTFANYIASAPAVNDDIFAFEAKYAATHNDLPVNFYLATGENDHLAVNGRKFVSQLGARSYPGLKFDYLFTANGNHGTIQPTAYIEGLRFVLDSAVELPPAAFARLAGSYSDGENTYTLSYDGGNFLAFDGVPVSYDVPLSEWGRIYARSATEFFSKGWPGEFVFGGDPGQPAQTLSFKWEGRDITATRQ